MKKSHAIILVCLCAAALILMVSDPIVVSVESPEVYYATQKCVFPFSLDDDSDVRYYLKDGCDPLWVTVYYLNREPERLSEALEKGHITLDDLEGFDIEYGIYPN